MLVAGVFLSEVKFLNRLQGLESVTVKCGPYGCQLPGLHSSGSCSIYRVQTPPAGGYANQLLTLTKRFPHDPYIKDKWIRATGKCNWIPQKHDTVCSEHFDDGSFMKKASKTYLFLDAVPTLKLHPIFDEIDSLTNSITFVTAADLTLPKRRKKKKHLVLTTANRIKKKIPPEPAPELFTKEEGPSAIAPENRMNEEGRPSLVTTVHIKEEDTSDTATEIQLTEESPPDLATTVYIKREDPLALAEIIVEVPPLEPPKESRAPREEYYTINAQDSTETRHLKRSLKVAQETIRRERLQVKRFRECNRRLIKKLAKMENIIKSLREQSADN